MKQPKKSIPVRVYLPDDDDGRKIAKRLKAVSKRANLSVSRIAGMAIQIGLARVEEIYTDVAEKMEAK